MGIISHLFYPWGLILQVVAIVHFIRRRPDTYWIFVILFLGPLGALIYLCAEALPDIGLARQSFKIFPRRKRIGELEIAIRDNPSAGNYEELGNLYMDDGNFQSARAAFDKAIAARADTLDTFYRRGICALQLSDATAAIPDLERAVGKESDYDFHRAAGLLARAYAQTGQKEKAEAAVPPGDSSFNIVRDVFELRGFARVGGKERRSTPMGTEGARQAAHHARLSAPPRAPLVPQRQCDAEATACMSISRWVRGQD
jgi:hypothetical protein